MLPASSAPLLALPCSSAGGSFVIESNSAGNVVAATYLRQGDDSAVRIMSPGHILVFRNASGATVPLDLTVQPAMNFGCLENLASGVVGPPVDTLHGGRRNRHIPGLVDVAAVRVVNLFPECAKA